MKKKASCFLSIMMVCVYMVGCGQKGTILDDIQVDAPMLPVLQVDKEELLDRQNLLTGRNDLSEEAVGKRPVAVMVNNVPEALPQYGVAKADIIFEIPVEGDLTRLMALYADYTQVPKVCAIRSCRYYFPAFAKGFDAFYVNWGMDETIRDYVKGLKIDQFDGMSNPYKLFGRDSARRKSGYSLEHTGYFDGTKFAKAIQADGKRTDLLENKRGTAFQFYDVGVVKSPQGETCTKAKVNFGATTATLTYDEATKTYLKQINGKNHMDGVTGTQLAFTNVFVLETSISVRDTQGHKKVDWKGTSKGTGYYLSNGSMQKIKWSKADEGSYLRFYDQAGNELTINRGKSYIAVNYAGKATYNS